MRRARQWTWNSATGTRTWRSRVRDNGPGPTAAPSGHGLLGMRERAATVGGTLRTGPAPGGGFLVEARLPVTSQEAVALP